MLVLIIVGQRGAGQKIEWGVANVCGLHGLEQSLSERQPPFTQLSFMDANVGYRQIAEQDRVHTTFITPQGVYSYKMMSFGLKNAEATYQWTVNKIFND